MLYGISNQFKYRAESLPLIASQPTGKNEMMLAYSETSQHLSSYLKQTPFSLVHFLSSITIYEPMLVREKQCTMNNSSQNILFYFGKYIFTHTRDFNHDIMV